MIGSSCQGLIKLSFVITNYTIPTLSAHCSIYASIHRPSIWPPVIKEVMKVNKNFKVAVLTACVLGTLASASLPSYAGNQRGFWGNREQRFDNRHPRRSEVLDRAGNLNNRINADRGNLDGHYQQLSREDRSIRRQEQRDARMNGGHITAQEQQHLNREENRLNNQIRRDQ